MTLIRSTCPRLPRLQCLCAGVMSLIAGQSTGDRQDHVCSVMDGSVPNTILRLAVLQARLTHSWPAVKVEKGEGESEK